VDYLRPKDSQVVCLRQHHDAGNVAIIRSPLAALATIFDRLGRHEAAATIAGFALSPFAVLAAPEIGTAIGHLRETLGDSAYESLARKGESMTAAAVANYAYDQIDQARAELNGVSKWTTYESLRSQSRFGAPMSLDP
jgi:hypothetical protein